MGVGPGEIKSRWDRGIQSVRKEIIDYRLNDAFLEGEQWVHRNPQNNRIEQYVRRDPERAQLTVNVMRKAERTVMGVLHTRPLFFQITPTAADDATVAAARLGLQILDNYARTQDWERIRADCDQVVFRGGTGALALEWDPDAGEPIQGQPGTYTGDIVVPALSMGEFVVEAGARDGERARYWIKALAVPVDQAKADWGLSETPKPDSQWSTTPMMRVGEAASKDLVTVFTYYERPHRDSDGEMAVMIGEEIVDSGPWPFPFRDRLNLAIGVETAKHAKWYGSTVVSDTRSPQVALNMSHSSIIEHLKTASNARTWVSWEDYDRIEELTDTPGEFAPYSSVPPKVVAAAQQPAWWANMPDRLQAVIDGQLGATEVLAGIAPRNVESGYGIGILSENAQSPLGKMIDQSARAWGTIATLALRTLEVKVSETRSGAYVNDPADLPEEFSWKGSDLRGQTTVVVPKDGIAPRSRAQVEAWAQSAFAGGHISMWQMLRLTEVPALPSEKEILDQDSARQQRENRRMARGEEAVVQPYDDHAKHLAVLNDFRKSEAYEHLDETTRALFDRHAEEHDAAAGADAAKDAMRQTIDPNLALAPNAEGTPGSVPLEGADDGTSSDDLDLGGGSSPFDVGEGLGPGGEVGGLLPPGGLPY